MDFEEEEEFVGFIEEEEEEIGVLEDSIPIDRKRKAEDDLSDESKRLCEEAQFAGDLVQAARIGDFGKVQKIIAGGANVNNPVCECTALMYAAFYGREEMVQFLITQGANVDWMNSSGQTALMWAVERNHIATATILIRKGKANVNIADNKGLTALHTAVRYRCMEMVKILVEDGGAKLNMEITRDMDSYTVFQDAAFYGHLEIVEYLLEQGAKMEQKVQGRTALHRAVYKNHSSVAQFLLDCGAEVDAVEESNRRTSLHQAAFFGHLETLKVLLDSGADVNIKDKIGLTAQDVARNRKQEKILEHLAQFKPVSV